MSLSSEKCLLTIVKDFAGQYEDELSVEQGQIAQFIQKLDKYWFEVFIENQIGKIPIDCCREIKPEMLDTLRINPEDNVVFVGKHDFLTNCQEGDLRFARNEIIIGFNQIDNDWWNGTRLNTVKRLSNHLVVEDSDCGIFPSTFVWKLRNELLPEYIFHRKGVILKSLLNHKENNENLIEPNQPIEPSTDENSENISKNNSNYLFYVRVIKTMEAQLDEEINLPDLDEILGIISIHDQLYYKGESLSRRVKGIFPKNFVAKIEENEMKKITEQTKKIVCDNQDSDNSNSTSPIPPEFPPPPPPSSFDIFNYKPDKLFVNTFKNKEHPEEGSTDVNDHDLPPSYEVAVSYGYANDMFNEMEPYGRALYDFEALDDTELSVRQNQIVRLISYYDDEWMECETNGKIGFVPRSYISVIVDCKQENKFSETTLSESNQNQVTAIEFPENTFAKILYDFDGEMEQDLKVKAGDVITLLRKFTSTDWIEAQDASGNVGFVHLNLCQVFESSDNLQQSSSNLKEPTQNVDKNSHSLYPKIPDASSDEKSKDSSQPTASTSSTIKPHRPAPIAPRRNNVFPTFNQFLIQEKQEHYQFDLDGNESSILTVQSSQKSAKSTQRSQRGCVITELIQTEKDYCHALNVCHQVFYSSSCEANKCKVDLDKILNNMKDIIKVSKNLIKLLENYAHNRDYIDQRVGICFLDLKFEINESYTQYCRNHSSVHTQVRFYEDNVISSNYMKSCLGKIQDQTNCFDLSSIWIKPVQRILKYPLLLNELIKYTEEDHVDYEPLKMAFQMITDIATCINEHKRRQDLIQKYCKTKDPTLTEKLKNLSLHSVKKKSSRLGYRILSTLTFSSGTKDKDYDSALQTFQEVDKTIRTFIKDLRDYMNCLEKYYIQRMVCLESISEYCDLKRNPRFDIDVIREKYRRTYQDSFEKFKKSIERNVFKTLESLLDRFNGPFRLINKREDKRIDFEASLKSKGDTNLTKSAFEALNKQLIDELPILTEKSLQILSNCIEAFLYENKLLIGIIAKYQLDIHDLPLVKNTTFSYYEDIEDNFRVKYNLNFEQMFRDFTLIHRNSFQESTSAFTRLTRSRGSNTWKNSLPINKSNQEKDNQQKKIGSEVQCQQESDRKMLISKYDMNHMYTVNNNYEPCDILEISAHKGDMVGVIKYQEPNGKKNRWFVDLGYKQGFLPRTLLTGYSPPSILAPSSSSSFVPSNHRYDPVASEATDRYYSVPLEPQRYCNLPSGDINEQNSDHSSLMSLEEVDSNVGKVELKEFDPLAAVTTPTSATSNQSFKYNIPETSTDDNYYKAAYPFKASGPNQLALEFNERVLVLKKHDSSGNPEWWFIQNSKNHKGYVPGNYLTK